MEKLIKALLVITVIASFSTGCMKRRPRSKIDLVSEEICSRFIEIVEKKYPELRPIGTGGGVKDGKITLIQIVFKTDELLTLDSARDQVSYLGNTLFQLVASNPEMLEWFGDEEGLRQAILFFLIGAEPPVEDCLSYVKCVFLGNGTISYTTSDDPYGPCIPLSEEPWIPSATTTNCH